MISTALGMGFMKHVLILGLDILRVHEFDSLLLDNFRFQNHPATLANWNHLAGC